MPDEASGPAPFGPAVYPKAQVFNRFIAKFVDLLVVVAASLIASPVGVMMGLTYVLIADGLSGGRSFGKRLIGLQTVIPQTQEVSGFRESVIRNFPFCLAFLAYQVPYIGWAIAGTIITFEGLLVIGNDRGLRLGDEVASTQVLDAGQLDLRD